MNHKLIPIIKSLVEIAEQYDDIYFDAVNAIGLIFPRYLIPPLNQLVNNPTEDGDVMSKSCRDDLLAMGLATRVCCKGEQGYTGTRYIGWSILDKIKERAKPEK